MRDELRSAQAAAAAATAINFVRHVGGFKTLTPLHAVAGPSSMGQTVACETLPTILHFLWPADNTDQPEVDRLAELVKANAKPMQEALAAQHAASSAAAERGGGNAEHHDGGNVGGPTRKK